MDDGFCRLRAYAGCMEYFKMAAMMVAVLVGMAWCGTGCEAAVSNGERLGLELLYNTTQGPSWVAVPGWQNLLQRTVDPCVPTPWTGITCGTGPDRIR